MRLAWAAAIAWVLGLTAWAPAQAENIVRAPADFRFVLHFWVKDVYDSARGEWLLDQVCEPPDTLRIALTPAQRDTVWTELADLGFVDLPPVLRDCREGAPRGSLEEHWALSITANGRENSVSWDCDLDGLQRRVPLLCRSIVRWLMDTPQFRSRRPPPCGYL